MMEEMFEEVLAEVGMAHDCSGWWEVYDSDLFSEVMDILSERYGAAVLESEEFLAWEGQLAEDL